MEQEQPDNHQFEADLRGMIERRQVVVVIGSGVSMATNPQSPTWRGLIGSAIERCRTLGATDAWCQRVTDQLALESDADMLLAAAELVHGKLLKQGGELAAWLRETFEPLAPVDDSVIKALAALQIPLVTTNYDDLIEKATGFRHVTWKEPGIVTRVARGDDRRVLHLYGYWAVPDSVVLGIRSYESVRQNEHLQAVLKAFGMTKSFLFVGCGDEGLADPNFGNFLSWLAAVETATGAGHRHYRLVRSIEKVEPNGRVFPLVYGDDYAALPAFLQRLCPKPAAPVGGAKKKFFISYRRTDAPTAAHHLCEKMVERFGAAQVFFDVDSIPLGIDFHRYITEQVNASDVLVVLIGRQWLDVADEKGNRRLLEPNDFVRIEIETALAQGIPIVPVLVENASMPRVQSLPVSLRALAQRSAAEIRPGALFRQQVEAFLIGLERITDLPSPSMQTRFGTPLPPVADTRKVSVEERTGITFVTIPAGEFDMGAAKSPYDDERPVHRVRLWQEFRLGKYPVTNEQYALFLKAAGGQVKLPAYWDDRRFNQPEQPVVGVSWNDAQAFCQWAHCRLPTEAEWEYACRAHSTTDYCFGDDPELLGGYAWFTKNSGGQTKPVGTKRPNDWGLHDMHGNVWEWCQDWDGSYSDGEQDNPTGPVNGTFRVLRGGSWINDDRFARSAIRIRNTPDYRFSSVGFRVVCCIRTS